MYVCIVYNMDQGFTFETILQSCNIQIFMYRVLCLLYLCKYTVHECTYVQYIIWTKDLHTRPNYNHAIYKYVYIIFIILNLNQVNYLYGKKVSTVHVHKDQELTYETKLQSCNLQTCTGCSLYNVFMQYTNMYTVQCSVQHTYVQN